MSFMNKIYGYCVAVVSTGIAGSIVYGTYLYFKNEKEEKDHKRKVEEAERKQKEDYWANMTPEQKTEIERQTQITAQEKYKKEQMDLQVKKSEAESKKRINEFKYEILKETRKEALEYVKNDSKKLFNDWSEDMKDRIDKKLDRLEDQIDDLKDDMVTESDFVSLKKRVGRLNNQIDDGSETRSSTPTSTTPVITVAPVING